MFGFLKKKEQEKAPGTAYTPPKMPPFPVDYDGVMKVLAPYYQQERPLDFFFEMYAVDVIKKLPPETIAAISAFSAKHPTFFAKHCGDWRQYVVKENQLSDTIEIAIWDLWIRNSANASRSGWVYHPWHFAQDFAGNYFADGSKVDVWEGNALEARRQTMNVGQAGNRYSIIGRLTILIAMLGAGLCTGCMKKSKAELAHEMIGDKVLIVLAKEPDRKGNILDVQDYVRNGESYVPFFSSKEAFHASARGAGLGKRVWAIDRRLFVELTQSNQTVILNVGLPTETRFTGAELKCIFPEPFTTNGVAQQSAAPLPPAPRPGPSEGAR